MMDMLDAITDARVPAILCIWLMWILVAMCIFGLVCKNYKDNWAQTFGLFVMIWPLMGRAIQFAKRETLSLERLLDVDQWDTLSKADTVSVALFTLISGMTLFGVGTAWKVWKHRHSNTNPNGTAS